MIALKNISYAYTKGHDILSDLNLTIMPGTVCGLLGRNGVGKSTMLYLISGLLRPQSGSIDCNGYIPFSREASFLREIFIVPEEFELPNVTLEEYVKVNAPFYPKFSHDDMTKLLRLFELDGNPRLNALSMGQKKKVFLSFAIACNTSVLLMDEPTNGLDITAKRAFRVAVSMMMNEDKIILISTHQVHDVEQILDHVVIADNNSILLNASMSEISGKLKFRVTSDVERINRSLFSIPVPGGSAIVEPLEDPVAETEVNLECLFEMADKRRDLIRSLFPSSSQNIPFSK